MELKLYHGGFSVCSAKVRVGLAEKNFAWESFPIDLVAGEQFDPNYLKINRNGVVPSLIDDGTVITESSIILEHIDMLSPHNRLMPAGRMLQSATRLWLLRCLEIHSAINTMTFSTVNRHNILAANTPEQIADSIAKIPNPKAAAKRRDLLDNGLASAHVTSDFQVLATLFDDMQSALEKSTWLMGNEYSMADTAVIAYIDRLDRLGMAGMWEERTPKVGEWLNASKSRPSYAEGIEKFTPIASAEKTHAIGAQLWPEVKQRWDDFLANR